MLHYLTEASVEELDIAKNAKMGLDRCAYTSSIVKVRRFCRTLTCGDHHHAGTRAWVRRLVDPEKNLGSVTSVSLAA